MASGRRSTPFSPMAYAVFLGLAVWYGAQMLAGPVIMWIWVALELNCNYGCLFVTFGLPIIAGVVSAIVCYRRSCARLSNQPPPTSA